MCFLKNFYGLSLPIRYTKFFLFDISSFLAPRVFIKTNTLCIMCSFFYTMEIAIICLSNLDKIFVSLSNTHSCLAFTS